MTITLYKNKSEVEKLNKSLELVATKTGVLREGASVTAPSVRVELGELSLSSFNYMYIPEFGRYYFITDIVAVNNKLMDISGRVDVLMSFKTDIENTTAIIERSSKNGVWNAFINDPDVIVEQDNYILVRNGDFAPFSFDEGSYILAVAGGDN